ncbi:amidohydrolase, partial [Microbacterium sp. H6]
MTRTLYRNARIFTGDESRWAEAIVVDGEEFIHVGSEAEAPHADAEVDLGGRVVLPGFTDAHTHLLMMGEALGQVGLTDAASLEEIQRRLDEARRTTSGVLRGRGWLFDAIPDGEPTATMIDAVVADIPVYLDANDYHSCWVNTAALRELGITRDTPDPLGGRIARDASGEPTGMLYETAAQQYAWAQRDASTTDAQRDAAVARVVSAYLSAGVTGAVDMAFDELGLAALERAAERGELPLRVAAHWFVANSGDDAANLAQVAQASVHASASTAGVRVVGIKLVLDGTIDACTAAMGA